MGQEETDVKHLLGIELVIILCLLCCLYWLPYTKTNLMILLFTLFTIGGFGYRYILYKADYWDNQRWVSAKEQKRGL